MTHVISVSIIRICFLMATLAVLAVVGCKNPKSAETKPPGTVTDADTTGPCTLDDDDVLQLADSILEAGDNKNVWNLSGVDSVIFDLEDYFTNSRTKSRLACVEGEAGMSAGSAHFLLILFDCHDTTARVIWSGQVGDINPDDIKDYNNDGIKEIVITSGTTWMGEENSSFEIDNFKDNRQNVLYSASSRSVLDAGADQLAELYHIHDTLESRTDSRLVPGTHPGMWVVKEVNTYKIHNGGMTNEGIVEHLKTVTDSNMVELK